MNIDDLTTSDRLGLMVGALARFASAPLDSRKKDITDALKQFQIAWIEAREVDPDGVEVGAGGSSNEHLVIPLLQAVRHHLCHGDEHTQHAAQSFLRVVDVQRKVREAEQSVDLRLGQFRFHCFTRS